MEPPFLSPRGEVARRAQRESWQVIEGGGEKATLIPVEPTQAHLWVKDPVFPVKQHNHHPPCFGLSPLELNASS